MSEGRGKSDPEVAAKVLEVIQRYESAGLLRALEDLTRLSQQWAEGGKVQSPGIALLAVELFACSLAERAGIAAERREHARTLAEQLLPYVQWSDEPHESEPAR